MADTDELYAKNKEKLKLNRRSKIIAFIIVMSLAAVVFFALAHGVGEIYFDVGMAIAFFIVPVAYKILQESFVVLASPSSELSRVYENLGDLKDLETERVELLQTIKRAIFIAAPVALICGATLTYFFDILPGIFVAVTVFLAIKTSLASRKQAEFRANFKERVVRVIVKKHGLSYCEDMGLRLDDFRVIYDCEVDRWRSEDMVSGEIDGVRAAFSDFYAAKVKRTKNGTREIPLFCGVLFKAEFNKKFSAVTQICHVGSKNLARYGKKANMDDARFEEIFDVYTTDQIGARYVLTPLLMQKFSELYFRLESRVNAVFKDDQIFIAIETGRDNFEPDTTKSLADDATIAFYESEIENFTQIVRELNLNRKIW